eukprot:scaffold2844_cov326-Pavlova_lutheri.AAC.26
MDGSRFPIPPRTQPRVEWRPTKGKGKKEREDGPGSHGSILSTKGPKDKEERSRRGSSGMRPGTHVNRARPKGRRVPSCLGRIGSDRKIEREREKVKERPCFRNHRKVEPAPLAQASFKRRSGLPSRRAAPALGVQPSCSAN